MPVQLCAGIISCHGDAGIERAVSNVELTVPDIARVIFRVRRFTWGSLKQMFVPAIGA